MKQLDMTPALAALIQAAVGVDVDPNKLAVFETIALNTKPLPGKRGALFENAVVQPVTLAEMVKSINDGNHLPLIADHELMGEPKGRFFHAGLDYSDGVEMRALFYLDETEAKTIAKLNAGSLDEVSVAFLSREFNCSECGWDYFKFGGSENIWERTCANGHKIGHDGVHGEMVGLNQFIELSLVARGAADKPKIIGKSQARLAPEGLQKLAANGFETDELVVQASLGKKEDTMSDAAVTALTAQLSTLSTEKGTLVANLSAAESRATSAEGQVTQLTADKTSLEEQVATLTAEKADLEKRPDASVKTDLDAALAYLAAQYDHLTVASGKPKVEGDARPKDVAAFTAAIDEMTGKLTSIIPVGGKAAPAGGAQDEGTAKLSAEARKAAYGVRN